MGAAEIRLRLGGISRQHVHQRTQRSDWPAPYDELVQGRCGGVKMPKGGERQKGTSPHLDSPAET
jgi:hypothetical protein